MQTIKIGNRIIKRADEGYKVKFVDSEELYSEISLNIDDKVEVEEVKEDA